MKKLTVSEIKNWFAQSALVSIAWVLRDVLDDYELGLALRGTYDYKEMTAAINDDKRTIVLVRSNLYAIEQYGAFNEAYNNSKDKTQDEAKAMLRASAGGIGTMEIKELFFAATAPAQYRALCLVQGVKPERTECIRLAREFDEEDEEYGYGDDE